MSILYVSETADSIRSKIIGYAFTAGQKMRNWTAGGIGQQILESVAPTIASTTEIVSQAIRGFGSLDTSTDPGDVDAYDPSNQTLEPAPGFLSDKGRNEFGTERIGNTFAAGTITWTNSGTGAVSQTFGPDALTFQRNYADANGYSPTYRNQDGGPVYARPGGGTITANSDGTLTVGPGLDVYLPISCEQPGKAGESTSAGVTFQVNALPGVLVTNVNEIIGSDREGADAYRARCRIAPASVSPNGPADAYRYIALSAQQDAAGNVYYFPVSTSTTAIGIDATGNLTSFPNASGGVSLGITRAQVSNDSAIGATAAYFASATGAILPAIVTSITDLLDAVYWPDATTRTLGTAIVTSVTVAGTVKAKAGSGVSVTVVAAAIDAALAAAFQLIDIGGYDQTAGAGTLYADYVKGTIERAHPAIYHVTMSSPAGDVALLLGHVATLANTINSGNVTIV